MDLNPVTRTSAVAALILNVLYCLLVLALLLWVFHWGRVSIIVVALLLLAVIIIPGFFALRPQTERGEDYTITSYGARGQGQLTVPVPVSELPRLVERACAQHAKLGLRELDAQGGRISVGITFSSWGARVRFVLRPVSETASQIVATSRPRMPLELLGRARSEGNLSLLFRGVAQEAERTHTSVTWAPPDRARCMPHEARLSAEPPLRRVPPTTPGWCRWGRPARSTPRP